MLDWLGGVSLVLAILLAIFGEEIFTWHWKWGGVPIGPFLTTMPAWGLASFVVVSLSGFESLFEPVQTTYLLVLQAGGAYFLSSSCKNLLKLESSPLLNAVIILVCSLSSILLTAAGATAVGLGLLLSLNRGKNIAFTSAYFCVLVNGVGQGPLASGPALMALQKGLPLEFFTSLLPTGLLLALLGSFVAYQINSWESLSDKVCEEKTEELPTIGVEWILLLFAFELVVVFLPLGPMQIAICLGILVAAGVSEIGQKARFFEPKFEKEVVINLIAILFSLLIGVKASEEVLHQFGEIVPNLLTMLPSWSHIGTPVIYSVFGGGITAIADNAAAFVGALTAAKVSDPGTILGTTEQIMWLLLWFCSFGGGLTPIGNNSTILGFLAMKASLGEKALGFFQFVIFSFLLYFPIGIISMVVTGPFSTDVKLVGIASVFVILLAGLAFQMLFIRSRKKLAIQRIES